MDEITLTIEQLNAIKEEVNKLHRLSPHGVRGALDKYGNVRFILPETRETVRPYECGDSVCEAQPISISDIYLDAQGEVKITIRRGSDT